MRDYVRILLCFAEAGRALSEACLECMCDDYRGTGCDVDELCGRPRSADCDLLGVDRAYWERAGKPVAAGKERDVQYGELLYCGEAATWSERKTGHMAFDNQYSSSSHVVVPAD